MARETNGGAAQSASLLAQITQAGGATPADVATLFEAGERLLDALNEEHRRSKLYPKDIGEVVGYLEAVAVLRQRVDECAREYCRLLAEFGFPEVSARQVIEYGQQLCAPVLR